MTNKKLKAWCAGLAISALTAGCGGGAGTGGTNQPDTAVRFAGALQIYDTARECMTLTTRANYYTGLPETVPQAGYNALLFDDNATGYRICGDWLWVGKFTGALTATNVGSGSTTMTVYVIGDFGAIRSTGLISGVVFTSGNGNTVSSLDFYDAQISDNTRLQTSSTNFSYANDITGSYATLAGSYVSNRTGTGLTIAGDGSFSGTSTLGPFTGKILKLNADTHVHKVSLTYTAGKNVNVTMTGVLGPYGVDRSDATPPEGGTRGAVMLAVTGNGLGYADVLSHR